MAISLRRARAHLLARLLLLGAVALLAGGCLGGDSDATPSASPSPTREATPPPSPTAEEYAVAEYARVVPEWIEGLDTQAASRLRDPFNYYATWPVIDGYPLLGDELWAIIQAARAAFDEHLGPPLQGSLAMPEFNVSFEFIVASGSVIGVRLEQYEFFGAGGANLATTVWFDTAAHQRVPATALLDGEAALQQVVEIVRDTLRNERPDLMDVEFMERGTAPTEENYDAIGFTPEGDLLIEFDEYQVGPGASGEPRVVIPNATVAPLLSEFGLRAQREVTNPSAEIVLATPTPTPTPTPPPPTATPSPSPTATAMPTATATAGPTQTPGASVPPGGTVDCEQVACVALTFDDGPGRPTGRLLDILAAHGSRATFFVVGVSVQYSPEMVARIVDEGHEVGNHTFNHRDLTKLGGDALQEQVDETNDAIKAATGQRPRLLRPPYGAMDERTAALVGMPMVLWSVDPRDWADHDAALVAQRVAENARRGSIVLLHDIHETTVDAVPAILADFDRRGLHVVTVSELLGDDLVAGRSYRGR